MMPATRRYAVRFTVHGNLNTVYIRAESKNDALLLAGKRFPHGTDFFIAGVMG